jgi:protein phosphatase
MPRITYAGLTHQGRVRTQNEDRWTADPAQGLFIVSDGMGGQPAGALASRIVVETLPALLRTQMQGIDDLTTPEATQRLLSAIALLSEQVRCGSQGQPGLDGMGATVVLALLRGTQVLIAHMGDSRAYLVCHGCLEQLTTDHSLVQLLLDCGEITSNDAASHPAQGQLTRYIGMPGEPLPEARLLALCPGDRLLLCSDGLTGMVRDAELLALLQKRLAPRIVCQRLIAAANAAGGTDNITALVVSVSRRVVRGRVRVTRSSQTHVRGCPETNV